MSERTKPRITHIGFYCRDLAASIAWYTDVLGMNQQFGVPGQVAAMRFAEDGPHDIFLVQAPENYAPPTPMEFAHETLEALAGRIGFYHAAIDFLTFDQAMRAYGRARARGSALAKAVQHGDGRGIYVRDPDGNLIELYSFNGAPDDELAAFAAEAGRYEGSDGLGGGWALDAERVYQAWRDRTGAPAGA